MRGNCTTFSGSSEDEIREGIRRIGKVVREQVALYETITGEHRAPPAEQRSAAHREEPAQRGAAVLPLRRRKGR